MHAHLGHARKISEPAFTLSTAGKSCGNSEAVYLGRPLLAWKLPYPSRTRNARRSLAKREVPFFLLLKFLGKYIKVGILCFDNILDEILSHLTHALRIHSFAPAKVDFRSERYLLIRKSDVDNISIVEKVGSTVSKLKRYYITGQGVV